jgi:hypothetical protein
MDTKPEDGRTSSHPKDRTLAAYKAWMTEIANRLTTIEGGLGMTERDWIGSWQEYWKEIPPS